MNRQLEGAADPPEPTDAELAARVGTDPTALATLYDRHASLVFGLAQRVLGNAEEARDLTQEVFMTLRTQAAYDPSRGSMAGYLATVTRTRAIDRVRFQSRKVRLLRHWWRARPDPTPASSAFDRVTTQQAAGRVREALSTLGEHERRAIEMAYFRGLSQAEIAEELGVPLGTVKSWTRRGLLALRGLLGDLVE